MPGVTTVTVQELRQMLAQNTPPLLLDVRELEEWQFCRIEGARHLPMSQIQHRVGELETTQETVVYCHHSVRSHMVAEFLTERCRIRWKARTLARDSAASLPFESASRPTSEAYTVE